MSWFKIFSAVLAAHIVFVLILLAIMAVSASAYYDYQTERLSEQLRQFQEQMDAIAPMTGRVQRPSEQEEPAQSSSRATITLSAVKTNKRMCEFWRSEYRDDPTERHKAYMDNACLRWKKSLREINQ